MDSNCAQYALYVSFLEHLEFEGWEENEIKKYLSHESFKIRKELRNVLGL